jgi:hypothetical protein
MYDIQGTVTDPNQGIPVQGATVRLSAQELSNGTFSSSYATLATTTTSSSGTYSFQVSNRNIVDYKIEVSKSNYFEVEETFSPESMSPEIINTRNYSVLPQGYANFHISHTTPHDSTDSFIYQNVAGYLQCSTCCNHDIISLPGENVDTTYTCMVYGHTYLKYNYFVTENQSVTTVTDSIFITSFDTAYRTIEY